ncbi:MAG: S1 RNA-binding domain-containing protein [Oligoflexia bacterium]|nr:S1 RNA-binding domain-containing protein [Oligoflexia bacterium]
MKNKINSNIKFNEKFSKEFGDLLDQSNEGDDDSGEDLSTHSSESSSSRSSSPFNNLLQESFSAPIRKLSAGEKISCELMAIGDAEVFFSIKKDAGRPVDGTCSRKELLNSEGIFAYKVGDKLDLYITKVKGSEVSLSVSPTAKSHAQDILEAYRSKLPIEGKISEVCNGGVRVSIRGKVAFCPISQIDISRVENAADYVGQKLEFLISEITEGGRNIIVSRRKLLQSQRELSEKAFIQNTKEGDTLKGVIKKIEAFGAFVEIAPGVEGLLHVSELSWSRVDDPRTVVTIGQEVTVKVIKSEVKEGKLRISLSMKQTSDEPWMKVSENFKEGQIVTGKVIRCVKFGAFVEIAPGIEGLIPLSEMSYTKRVVRSDELFKEGERITVMIKEIQIDSRRALLSLKDAGSDPWALVLENFPSGSVVSGRVIRREVYGIFVELEEGIIGLLPKSKVAENPEFPYDKLKVGDVTTIQIDEIDMEGRRISLNVPPDPNKDEWKKHLEQKQQQQHQHHQQQTTSKNNQFSSKLADKFKNISIVKKDQ